MGLSLRKKFEFRCGGGERGSTGITGAVVGKPFAFHKYLPGTVSCEVYDASRLLVYALARRANVALSAVWEPGLRAGQSPAVAPCN